MRFNEFNDFWNNKSQERKKFNDFKKLPDHIKMSNMRYEFWEFVKFLNYLILGWAIIGAICIVFSMNSEKGVLYELDKSQNYLTYLFILHLSFILSLMYNLYCSKNNIKNKLWLFKIINFITTISGFVFLLIALIITFTVTLLDMFNGVYEEDSNCIFTLVFILLPHLFNLLIQNFANEKVEFEVQDV